MFLRCRFHIEGQGWHRPGADPGGGRIRREPPPKIGKHVFFGINRDFSHEIPQTFSRLHPLGAIFLSAPP
jgi:hypothetical protein